MVVFSSLQAAQRSGFQWYAHSEECELDVVVMDRQNRLTGRRERLLALARCTSESLAA